jgi:DegV family protein with EDD domain
MPIAVVTDSTAYLPPQLLREHNIAVVPVRVVVGGVSHEEGGDGSAQAVAEALSQWRPVTTSRPSPLAFLRTYEAAADAGADAVVSIHLSGDMSGTLSSAQLAAQDAPCEVRVLDSRTIGMAMGYGVLAAAGIAEEGGGLDDVVAAAEKRCAASCALFYVDTLEYLHRGGRIGAAAALLGSALAVKPLLTLIDGRIVPLEKVRTSSRARARLAEIAIERAGNAGVDMAVHHLASPARAAELAARLRAEVPGLRQLYARRPRDARGGGGPAVSRAHGVPAPGGADAPKTQMGAHRWFPGG